MSWDATHLSVISIPHIHSPHNATLSVTERTVENKVFLVQIQTYSPKPTSSSLVWDRGEEHGLPKTLHPHPAPLHQPYRLHSMNQERIKSGREGSSSQRNLDGSHIRRTGIRGTARDCDS